MKKISTKELLLKITPRHFKTTMQLKVDNFERSSIHCLIFKSSESTNYDTIVQKATKNIHTYPYTHIVKMAGYIVIH